jgi:hypothetical protein
MFHRWITGATVLLIAVGAAVAADKEVRGKLVSLDADAKKITIVENGKNAEYNLNSRGVVVTINGKKSTAGLEDKALRKGAEVTLTIPATGKLVRAIEIEAKQSAASDKPAAPKPGAVGDREVKGKLVSVNADDNKITIAQGGKNAEYSLNSRGLVVMVNNKESKDGLKDKALAKGAEVTLLIPARGKLVKEIVVERKITTSLKPKEPGSAPAKPKPATTTEKPDVKGTPATVVKVDLAKMTLTVKVDGRNIDLTIGEETKFIGPRGGNRGTGEKGLKDDVLAPGAEIHFVGSKSGKQVEEIHLPVRKSSDK